MFGVIAHDTDFSYADLRGAKVYSVHRAKRVRFDHALLGDPGTWQHSSPTSFTDNILPNSSFVGTDLRCLLITIIPIPGLLDCIEQRVATRHALYPSGSMSP